MHILILATALLQSALPAARPADDKLLGVLRTWLRDYLEGQYEVGDDYKNIAGKSLAKKAGLITKDMFQRDNGVLRKNQFSYREEIEVLMQQAGRNGGKEMAEVLLQDRAIGLDDVHEYSPAMVPFYIRELAEKAIREIGDGAAREWVARAASGDIGLRVDAKLYPALQAAAIRVLAAADLRGHADAIRKGLAHTSLVVRRHAAEALAGSADAANLAPLVEALGKESTEAGKQVLHLSIAQLISGCRHEVDHALRDKAGALLLGDLGGPTSWHYQAQLVDLLPLYGMPEAVPRLIGLLQRFVDDPAAIAAGRLTGVLRVQAYGQLTGMTGAFHPIDDVAGWQDHWSRVKDGFAVRTPGMQEEVLRKKWEEEEATRKAAAGSKDTAPKRPKTAGMGDGDFFGIPVRGSRVVFLIDASHPMREPLPITDRANQGRFPAGTTRIQAMQAECARAFAGLTTDTAFNVLAYNSTVQAAFKTLAPASEQNVAAAVKFARKQAPQQNIGLAEALILALGCQRLHPAAPGGDVDEIFVLNNRLPNHGPIKAPGDLVRLVQEVARCAKVRIHTVYIGTVDDSGDKGKLGERLMEDLAKATDGRFVRP